MIQTLGLEAAIILSAVNRRKTATAHYEWIPATHVVTLIDGLIHDEPTWRCHQNPFIGALGIQEPVMPGEPLIEG